MLTNQKLTTMNLNLLCVEFKRLLYRKTLYFLVYLTRICGSDSNYHNQGTVDAEKKVMG